MTTTEHRQYRPGADQVAALRTGQIASGQIDARPTVAGTDILSDGYPHTDLAPLPTGVTEITPGLASSRRNRRTSRGRRIVTWLTVGTGIVTALVGVGYTITEGQQKVVDQKIEQLQQQQEQDKLNQLQRDIAQHPELYQPDQPEHGSRTASPRPS